MTLLWELWGEGGQTTVEVSKSSSQKQLPTSLDAWKSYDIKQSAWALEINHRWTTLKTKRKYNVVYFKCSSLIRNDNASYGNNEMFIMPCHPLSSQTNLNRVIADGICLSLSDLITRDSINSASNRPEGNRCSDGRSNVTDRRDSVTRAGGVKMEIYENNFRINSVGETWGIHEGWKK